MVQVFNLQFVNGKKYIAKNQMKSHLLPSLIREIQIKGMMRQSCKHCLRAKNRKETNTAYVDNY